MLRRYATSLLDQLTQLSHQRFLTEREFQIDLQGKKRHAVELIDRNLYQILMSADNPVRSFLSR